MRIGVKSCRLCQRARIENPRTSDRPVFESFLYLGMQMGRWEGLGMRQSLCTCCYGHGILSLPYTITVRGQDYLRSCYLGYTGGKGGGGAGKMSK